MTTETNQRPTLSNGKICYIEIPAIDISRSVSFYKDVSAGRQGSAVTAASPLTTLLAK